LAISITTLLEPASLDIFPHFQKSKPFQEKGSETGHLLFSGKVALAKHLGRFYAKRNPKAIR